jgi:fibronectin-binding autotransporter adhesin
VRARKLGPLRLIHRWGKLDRSCLSVTLSAALEPLILAAEPERANSLPAKPERKRERSTFSPDYPMKPLTTKFLLTLSWISLPAWQNAYASTIAVTSIADNGPGTLRHALALASNGDKINITASGIITLTSGELVIDKSVTIRGPGAPNLSVSGNANSRVFRITPNMIVTISALTIANGRASGGFPAGAGGGIYSDHAQLTVSDCTISGNSARFGAGVFSNSMGGGSATLTINNSTLSNNSGQYGGGIFSGGGFFSPAPSGSASLTLNNSTVSNNGSLEGAFAGDHILGGGIFNDGLSGTATLTVNNSILGNNAALYGGGIYNNGDSGIATVTLVDSTVNGNAAAYGGGLYNDGISSFHPGNASMTLINTAVSGNYGDTSAGGIYNDGKSGTATLRLKNSNVADNFTFEFGGGIYNDGLSGNAILALEKSALSNNSSNVGGGIYNDGGTATLESSTLSSNFASFGGGIHNQGTVTLNNTTISDNLGIPLGGGILNSRGGTVALNSSTLSGNLATCGGGIYNGGYFLGETATVTLHNSTMSSNQAPSLGGGIFNEALFGGSAIMTLINSTLSGNSTSPQSSDLGGGIYNNADQGSAVLTVHNSTLSGNLAGSGGSIFNDGEGTVRLANTILNAGAPQNIVSPFVSVASQGYNLSSDAAGGFLTSSGDRTGSNPLLGPLQNNGGRTMTHALLLHSPAIDAGDPNFNPFAFNPPLLYDQRDAPGFPRVFNRLDIGAFESHHP